MGTRGPTSDPALEVLSDRWSQIWQYSSLVFRRSEFRLKRPELYIQLLTLSKSLKLVKVLFSLQLMGLSY